MSAHAAVLTRSPIFQLGYLFSQSFVGAVSVLCIVISPCKYIAYICPVTCLWALPRGLVCLLVL